MVKVGLDEEGKKGRRKMRGRGGRRMGEGKDDGEGEEMVRRLGEGEDDGDDEGDDGEEDEGDDTASYR